MAGVEAQSPWNGFFSPKAGLSIDRFRIVGLKSRQCYFRPAAEMTAVQFTYNKDTKVFKTSTFKSAGVGLGYQNYVERNGQIINNYGVNALLMLDASNPDAGIAIAGTINALQFVNLGCGYNFTEKQFFLLTGAVYNF